MTALPFKLAVNPQPTQFLLTVRGTLAAADMEGGRIAHNQTAGDDQGVAAARSFGDLSHAVYVPAMDAAGPELLIVDYWNSPEGIMQFFSDPQVKKGGGMLFRNREAVVWHTDPALPRVVLPAPTGRNERYAGIVRGRIRARDAAAAAAGEAVRTQVNTARARGLLSREFFFRLPAPGEEPVMEMIGLDVWFDADGMQADYAEPAMETGLGAMFAGPPEASVWRKPAGAWVEW
jgi:hypothetical protein